MTLLKLREISFIVILAYILTFPGQIAADVIEDQNSQENKSLPWLSLLLNTDVRDYIDDVDTDDRVSESEIAVDQYGRSIALTKLMIVFKLDTTPEQINELITSLNAVITCSVAGTRSIVVRIPQPADLAAYDTIISQITANPNVAFVWEGVLPEMDALPPNYNLDGSGGNIVYSEIDHHLAVRAHAAWNVRGAIKNGQASVVVADKFGRGPAHTDAFDYILEQGEFGTGLNGDPGETISQHGYGVLSVICGKYDGDYIPKGIFPEAVDLGVVDISENYDGKLNSYDMPTIINKILDFLKKTEGNVVLNTSFSEPCTGVGGKCQDEVVARLKASVWTAAVRDLGLESRVLHVTTAGNISDTLPFVNDARTKTPFAAARLLENLIELGEGIGFAVPNLANTLVVESAVHSPANDNTQQIVPKCQELHSFDGGDISAIGRDIITSRDPLGIFKDWEYGTSLAAPQVAGLAAYLWSVKSSTAYLRPSSMIILLKATEFDTPQSSPSADCSGVQPAPTIDAYTALLSVDATTSDPTMEGWPVRFGLMDVNNDKKFDKEDLVKFYNAYFTGSGVPREPVRNFGRYDLNGDEWTTVTPLVDDSIVTTMPFDLDRTGSIQFSLSNYTDDVTQIINNETVSYNELTVTDKDILCYYAYSTLYTGDTTVRDNLLLTTCGSNYTKIDSSGNNLPKTATDWTCVRDERTFLVWEKKTDDGGLRDKDTGYNWYDPNPATNGGHIGDSTEPNTYSYVLNVNSLGLCGASDWRMPSVYELEGLLEQPSNGVWINADYFPNTQGHYWTSSTSFPRSGYSTACLVNPYYAWYTNFLGGSSGCNPKSYTKAARLVRGS